VNAFAMRTFARPLTGLAVVAALLGVPATAASAATTPATAVPHSENYYCDFDSGYGCEGYGYGSDFGRGHGRHHRY